MNEQERLKEEEEFIEQLNKGAKNNIKMINQPLLEQNGKIISSGKSVHGVNTNFNKTMEAGDFLVVNHPQSGETEERKIVIVLSERSLLLEEPFSSDLINFDSFCLRK